MSIDEAYFDLSFSGSYQKVVDISKIIKKEIKEKENLTASIDIGPNKLVAKIASYMQKPNGLTVVGADAEKTSTELVEAFLVPLPIRKIPGIGPKTEQKFLAVEVRKIEELRKLSRQELESLMGKWSSELYEKIWAEMNHQSSRVMRLNRSEGKKLFCMIPEA